ncbi:uncharacterized protein LOC119103000 [Pollicipes pollicipes]|uniref:uncharacterized protein LOC119103000 n=1 Tax=Pollicipes pollicipes TaxID=41117 RepID=UPI001884C33A|nr:uncharacterized protein LOC119103000 [Pollicipes pollicipes]
MARAERKRAGTSQAEGWKDLDRPHYEHKDTDSLHPELKHEERLCPGREDEDRIHPERKASDLPHSVHKDASRHHPRKTDEAGSRLKRLNGDRCHDKRLDVKPSRCEVTDAASVRGGQGQPGRASGEPAARDLSIFTAEYLSELHQLQRRIMTSRDGAEMSQVLALIWDTGQVEHTALYYDFDLCALDQGVVRKLQRCLS